LGEQRRALLPKLLNQITTLEVGEALIVGEASQFPLFVSIRKKEVCDAKTGKSLKMSARSTFQQAKKEKADALDFMKG